MKSKDVLLTASYSDSAFVNHDTSRTSQKLGHLDDQDNAFSA